MYPQRFTFKRVLQLIFERFCDVRCLRTPLSSYANMYPIQAGSATQSLSRTSPFVVLVQNGSCRTYCQRQADHMVVELSHTGAKTISKRMQRSDSGNTPPLYRTDASVECASDLFLEICPTVQCRIKFSMYISTIHIVLSKKILCAVSAWVYWILFDLP